VVQTFPSATGSDGDSNQPSHPGVSVSQLILWVFVAWTAVVTTAICAGWNPPRHWQWIEIILPLLAALAALGSLSPRLPVQNLAAIGGLMLVFSAGMLACGTGSRFPFGAIRQGTPDGFLLLNRVPGALPLWWVALLVSSRETARLILRPWRRTRNYGLQVVVLAAVLLVVADLNWEPFAVQVVHLWRWSTAPGAPSWYSAPWVNFLGWFTSALVMLGFTAPWFIAKRPAYLTPRLDPALIWCALNLHFIAGNISLGLWTAVAVGGGLTAAVGWLAGRGLQVAAVERGRDQSARS
jgi:uncharacterized membrane protein